jgi:hypothetical protein
MTYNRQAHELLEQTLKVLVAEDSKTAYAKMVGYLIVNVGLDDAIRIAKIVEGNATA